MALPVTDLNGAADWYCKRFGMTEVARHGQPVPTVILERDGTRLGFAINGGDASQDGAAILVSNIHELKEEFDAAGLRIDNWRVDERDGQKLQVFFVVAPDGLCYYFAIQPAQLVELAAGVEKREVEDFEMRGLAPTASRKCEQDANAQDGCGDEFHCRLAFGM